MIGGGLLLGGIRNMLGGQGHGPFAGTFNHLSSGAVDSPLSGGQGSTDLARQAGLDDIGRAPSGGGAGETSRAGLLDASDEQGNDQESDDDHDMDGDEGDLGDDGSDDGGSDYA
jgi:hypothetical protein